MERIKRFLKDESGSSEAASSVILIAAVGMLLAAAIGVYYTAINGFFSGKVAPAIDGFTFGSF